MRHEEAKIQEAIVRAFNELVQLNQLTQPCLLYSNRNENKGLITGASYKRMGSVAGVPELTLIYKSNADGDQIAYIEVKTPKAHRTSKGVETKSKGMSEDQIDFYEKYTKPMGIKFAVVSSVTDFLNFIWFLRK